MKTPLELSDHIDFDQINTHARDLLAACRSSADAERLIARQYGFESWDRLREEVARRMLRNAIWQGEQAAVSEALRQEPGVINDAVAHPRWGGRPTPIQLAAERGQAQLMLTLLNHGADPDGGAESYGGWRALHLAAHWGHREAAELLLAHGAEKDIFAAILLDDISQVKSLLTVDAEAASRTGLGGETP